MRRSYLDARVPVVAFAEGCDEVQEHLLHVRVVVVGGERLILVAVEVVCTARVRAAVDEVLGQRRGLAWGLDVEADDTLVSARVASQRRAIRVSAAVKLSITVSARARVAIIVRVTACVTSVASRWAGMRLEGLRREPGPSGCVGLVWRRPALVSGRGGEVAANIYDRETLRKWGWRAWPAPASLHQKTPKSALGRRGEGDLARLARGMR